MDDQVVLHLKSRSVTSFSQCGCGKISMAPALKDVAICSSMAFPAKDDTHKPMRTLPCIGSRKARSAQPDLHSFNGIFSIDPPF